MIALALALAPEASPSPADLADARCAVVIDAFGVEAKAKGDKDGEVNSLIGTFFFVGKLVGRNGPSMAKEVLANADRDREKIKKEMSSLGPACLAAFKQAGDALPR